MAENTVQGTPVAGNENVAKKENQLPWLGDSSVVECRGWGGTIRPINPDFGVEGKGLVINGGMMDVNGGWMGAGSTRMPVYNEQL